MATLEQWENRETARMFDEDFIPTDKQITQIENCINHLPIQVSHNNPDLPNFLIFKLTPNDEKLKKFLVKQIFHTEDKRDYFTGLYEAPYVFIFVELMKNQKHSVEGSDHVLFTNLGFYMGALTTEAVSLDLDVCQIACAAKATKKFTDRITKKLIKRFEKEFSVIKETHSEYPQMCLGPVMAAVGVGKGSSFPAGKALSKSYIIHKDLQLPTYPSKKLEKRQPFMYAK